MCAVAEIFSTWRVIKSLQKVNMRESLQFKIGQMLSCSSAQLAKWLAVPMFCLALLFLVLLAGLTVVWVDMATPNLLPIESDVAMDLTTPAAADSFAGFRQSANWAGYILFGLMLAIWPAFWAEPLVCRWFGRNQNSETKSRWTTDLWSAICPPLRLAKPIAQMDGKIWLPRIGWHAPGKPLAKMLDKVFSKPMLCIALLILPILMVEFGFSTQVSTMPWLKLALSISTGLIWCAFAIEFIVMVSATDKKLAYVKKNWIDLAIILLPLVSFLRSLRVVRAANIAKFAKVQQLTKMSRIYRMRGLMAKSIRALMVLEVMHRILKVTPQKRIDKLAEKLAELEEEASEIRSQIKQLQAKIEESESNGSVKQNVGETEPYRVIAG